MVEKVVDGRKSSQKSSRKRSRKAFQIDCLQSTAFNVHCTNRPSIIDHFHACFDCFCDCFRQSSRWSQKKAPNPDSSASSLWTVCQVPTTAKQANHDLQFPIRVTTCSAAQVNFSQQKIPRGFAWRLHNCSMGLQLAPKVAKSPKAAA